VAARVAPDRSRLTLFVPRAFGVRCLNAVAVTGAVAAAFCRPTTIQTIQLKGSDAVLTPVTPGDLPHVRAMIAAFVSELRAIGHSTDLALLDVTHDPADLVGVTFSPDAAFVQTPGPAAGARL
jgi:hypothetical protein